MYSTVKPFGAVTSDGHLSIVINGVRICVVVVVEDVVVLVLDVELCFPLCYPDTLIFHFNRIFTNFNRNGIKLLP